MKSPSTRREWIEIVKNNSATLYADESPSTRREWIEIKVENEQKIAKLVSLHTEGVD